MPLSQSPALAYPELVSSGWGRGAAGVDEDDAARDADEPSQKDILQHLIDFLDAC